MRAVVEEVGDPPPTEGGSDPPQGWTQPIAVADPGAKPPRAGATLGRPEAHRPRSRLRRAHPYPSSASARCPRHRARHVGSRPGKALSPPPACQARHHGQRTDGKTWHGREPRAGPEAGPALVPSDPSEPPQVTGLGHGPVGAKRAECPPPRRTTSRRGDNPRQTSGRSRNREAHWPPGGSPWAPLRGPALWQVWGARWPPIKGHVSPCARARLLAGPWKGHVSPCLLGPTLWQAPWPP